MKRGNFEQEIESNILWRVEDEFYHVTEGREEFISRQLESVTEEFAQWLVEKFYEERT